jgi:hypothetical protein
LTEESGDSDEDDDFSNVSEAQERKKETRKMGMGMIINMVVGMDMTLIRMRRILRIKGMRTVTNSIISGEHLCHMFCKLHHLKASSFSFIDHASWP